MYDARGEAGLNDAGGMGGMDAQVRNALLARDRTADDRP